MHENANQPLGTLSQLRYAHQSNNRLRRHSSVSQLFSSKNKRNDLFALFDNNFAFTGKSTVRSKRQNTPKECPFDIIYMKPENDGITVFNAPSSDKSDSNYQSAPKNTSCNSSSNQNPSPYNDIPKPNSIANQQPPTNIQNSPPIVFQPVPLKPICNPTNSVTSSPIVLTTANPLNAPAQNIYQCPAKTAPSSSQSNPPNTAQQPQSSNPTNVTPSPIYATSPPTQINTPSQQNQCPAKNVAPPSIVSPAPPVQQSPSNIPSSAPIFFRPVPLAPISNPSGAPSSNLSPSATFPTQCPAKAVVALPSNPSAVVQPPPSFAQNSQQQYSQAPIRPNPIIVTPASIATKPSAPISNAQSISPCPQKLTSSVQPVISPSTSVQQSPQNVQRTPSQNSQQALPCKSNPTNVATSVTPAPPLRICPCPAKPVPSTFNQANANPFSVVQQSPLNVQNAPQPYTQQQAPLNIAPPVYATSPVNTVPQQYQFPPKTPAFASPFSSGQQPPLNVQSAPPQIIQPAPFMPFCNSNSAFNGSPSNLSPNPPKTVQPNQQFVNPSVVQRPPTYVQTAPQQYAQAPANPIGQTGQTITTLGNDPNRKCGFCIKNAYIFMGFQPKDVEQIKREMANLDEDDDEIENSDESSDCFKNNVVSDSNLPVDPNGKCGLCIQKAVVRVKKEPNDETKLISAMETLTDELRKSKKENLINGDAENIETYPEDEVESIDSSNPDCPTKLDLIRAYRDLSQSIAKYRELKK